MWIAESPSQDALRRFRVELTARIRLVRASDLPLLEWFGTYTHHRALIEQAFARQQSGEVLMLAAELNRFPVAQLWVDLARKRDEGVGVLWALRVLDCFHGMGLGTRLIRVAERQLAASGLRWAELAAEVENEGAQRLYGRLGYSPLPTVVERYGYRTPEGLDFEHTLHLVLFRKRLGTRRRRATPHAPEPPLTPS